MAQALLQRGRHVLRVPGETPAIKCHPHTHILREEGRKRLISENSGKPLTPGTEEEKVCIQKEHSLQIGGVTALRHGCPICVTWPECGLTCVLATEAAAPPQTKGRRPLQTAGGRRKALCLSERQGRLLSSEEKSVWRYLSPDLHVPPSSHGRFSSTCSRCLLANEAWNSNSCLSGTALGPWVTESNDGVRKLTEPLR